MQPDQKQEPKVEEKGIACNGCGCRDFFVRDTVRLSRGRIRRYRECRHCGRVKRTIEVAEGEEGTLF